MGAPSIKSNPVGLEQCFGCALVSSQTYCRREPENCAMVQYSRGFAILLRVDQPTMLLEVSERGRQTLTFERVNYSKFKHESQQTPASGDTNSHFMTKLLEFGSL